MTQTCGHLFEKTYPHYIELLFFFGGGGHIRGKGFVFQMTGRDLSMFLLLGYITFQEPGVGLREGEGESEGEWQSCHVLQQARFF